MNYLDTKKSLTKKWLKVKDVYDRIEEYYNTQSKYVGIQLKKSLRVNNE
jgi:hypothetical protein